MNTKSRRSIRWLLAFGVAAVGLQVTVVCRALPSFARQMDMQCMACHTEFPILDSLGRQFKLSGYTLSADQTQLPPLAVMLQPSFTATQAPQPGPAAPGFRPNDNWALSQASIFYSGRLFGPYASDVLGPEAAAIANKFGIFSQVTYDGAAKAWSWDNLDLRYADSGTIAGKSAAYGLYLNNNPTLEDPWNTAPAWNFPFSSSKLAPTPAASALIDGGLAQQVVGLGAYVMLGNALYLDVGGYRTLSPGFQKAVGVDPAGETEIAGAAPYGRIAWTQSAGNFSWETGVFGFAADTYPGRDHSAGQDRIADIGVDSECQDQIGKNDITTLVSVINEHDRWNASQALGNASNATDRLWDLKATIDYLYDKTYGFAAQYFLLDGSVDPLRYPASASGGPGSDGVILQANFLPINKRRGPSFWPRSNLKFSLQYVIYGRFDGAGRSARGNDTLYLESWIAF